MEELSNEGVSKTVGNLAPLSNLRISWVTMGMTLPPHEVFSLVFVTSCLHAIYTKKTMEKIHPQQTGTTFMPKPP